MKPADKFAFEGQSRIILLLFRHISKFTSSGEKQMFSLQDLLGQQQGAEAVDRSARRSAPNQARSTARFKWLCPRFSAVWRNNASTPQGAESLNNALEQNHDGGILDNLGGLSSMIFGGEQSQKRLRKWMRAAFSVIFSADSQGQVAEKVSQNSGLSTGQTAQILMMLAPIVMGYLGRQKQQQNLDAGGLSSWLGGQQQQIQQSPQGGFLNSLLDRDGDGSSMDDIASMAMNYFSNRK